MAVLIKKRVCGMVCLMEETRIWDPGMENDGALGNTVSIYFYQNDDALDMHSCIYFCTFRERGFPLTEGPESFSVVGYRLVL